jgi:hypothetical protein
MRLQSIALALGALALAAVLGTPAGAEQTFWTYSTGPLPKPAPTPSYGNIGIDYLYYTCPNAVGNNPRFNPYDTRANAKTQCTSHHHKPTPPNRRFAQTAPHPKHT